MTGQTAAGNDGDRLMARGEERNDEESNDGGCLLSVLDRPRDWQDIVSHVALFAVLAGLVLACIGYLTPRDYTANPQATARQQEAVELYYWRFSRDLDIVLLVGMGLIGLGGLMTSFLFFLAVVWPDCRPRSYPEAVALTSARGPGTGSSSLGHYGATCAASGN